MIQVSNLSFSYTKQPFISNMSFSVSSGEIFGFLGPSGAGKSTLQKILMGMLRTYQVSVMVNGIECKKRKKNLFWVRLSRFLSKTTYNMCRFCCPLFGLGKRPVRIDCFIYCLHLLYRLYGFGFC